MIRSLRLWRVALVSLPRMLLNKILKRWGLTLVVVGAVWGLMMYVSSNYNIKGSVLLSVQYNGDIDMTDINSLVIEQASNSTKKAPKFNGPTFLIIMCKGRRSGKNGTMRQIQQAGIMFKSALVFVTRRIRFFISTDSKDIRVELEKLVNNWPEPYRSNLVLKFVPVWKPSMESRMWTLGVECVMQRLFVPKMIPNEDAVIYADTDMLFMRSPEDLWAEFYNFNSTQMMAMGPCLYYYGSAKNSRTPFYGSSGLNAGLIMMNLTRMKKFPDGGWLQANVKAFDKHREFIELADQDIINIVFAKHPELMYELGCEWNYRPWQCKLGKNMCPRTSVEGVSLIHGNTKAFVNGKETKMMAMFEAWKAYELGSSLVELYRNITALLGQATVQGYKWECAKLENVDYILSQRLKSHLLKNDLMS